MPSLQADFPLFHKAKIAQLKTLPRDFYFQKTQDVARKLLGKGLLVRSNRSVLLCEIVEVEAYLSQNDAACHAALGKTKRNWPMFEEGGMSYVYLCYGMHYCANVVTAKEGQAEAVLIRAARPLFGMKTMAKNRGLDLSKDRKSLKNLLNGPGKLTQGLGVNLHHNAVQLDSKEYRLVDLNREYKSKEIVVTTRIGIAQAKDLLLRYYVKDSEYVSKKG